MPRAVVTPICCRCRDQRVGTEARAAACRLRLVGEAKALNHEDKFMKKCHLLFWVGAMFLAAGIRMVAAAASTSGATPAAASDVVPAVPPPIQILEIVAPPTRSAANPEKAAQSREAQRRLAEERAKQQQLAKEKAEEAMAAALEHQGKTPDRSVVFDRLIDRAERLLAEEKFQPAARTFADAMKIKPADLPMSEKAQTLQAGLKAQSTPVEVALKSDGETYVSIANLLPPQKLYSARIKLLPGDYEVKGARPDRKNVSLKLRVRDGEPAPAVVSVLCE
jgi:hypothetical protein